MVQEALRALVQRCPRLVRAFYWAGTSAISLEELGHRASLDLDLHSRRAMEDVRPLLAEIHQAFPGAFELIESPDESGFRGVLSLPGGRSITVEALSNYEDVRAVDLVASSTVPPMMRVTLARYLADKVQCIAERVEARDLVDLDAILRRRPELTATARRLVGEQDALLLAERLLAWSDREIEEDLRAYPDVTPEAARRARDMVLGWLRDGEGMARR